MAFDAYELAREINRNLRALLPRLKRADPDLFKQMRKAAASVPLNLAEGNRRLGGDRRHCFSIAFGSADEVRSILHTAEDLGYLVPKDLVELHALLDRELAMLYRLTH